MSKLLTRLGQFNDTYNGAQQRSLVSEIERALAKVQPDETNPQTAVAGGATYEITGFDNLVLCDTSAGNVTVELPLPEARLAAAKFEVNVKKDASANRLTITPTGGAVTDFGTDSIYVYNKGTSLCFRAAPDGWRIV